MVEATYDGSLQYTLHKYKYVAYLSPQPQNMPWQIWRLPVPPHQPKSGRRRIRRQSAISVMERLISVMERLISEMDY